MNLKERQIKRVELQERYKGIALMGSFFVEREYKKVFSFEDKTFGGILKFLANFDVFESGLKNLTFESEVDSNGYFTRMSIRFTHEGKALVSIFEGGCVRLGGKWVIHRDKGWYVLKEKSFDTNEELRFILNSSRVKAKLGEQTTLPRVDFYVDPLFDDELEVRFSNK